MIQINIYLLSSVHKKHKTPSKGDEIWRLKKIAKDGAYHKQLNRSGIATVNDLLLRYAVDPISVRKVRGSSLFRYSFYNNLSSTLSN